MLPFNSYSNLQQFLVFIAANVACCPKSAHFSLFLASESWLRGPETSTEVFATQWWYGINERNVVTNRSSNRLRIRMSRVQGWPDYIQNSTACTFLMIYQQKRYQWIWETSMIHSSLSHHEILISACYQESLPLFTLQSWRNSYPHSKQFHKNKQTKKKIEMIEKQHVNKLLTASFFVEGRIMLLLFISLNFIQINDHFHVVFSKINILEFGQRCSFLCKPV